MTTLTNLFSPIRVGTMTVPNRICETTNSLNAGRLDGLPDPPFIEHHVQKARGGVGWIGSETWVLPTPLPAGYPEEVTPGGAAVRMTAFDHPQFVERTKVFTDQVHAFDAVCVMQLTHLQSLMAPSPVQTALVSDLIPHVMTEEEIEPLVDSYSKAAEMCRDAGADAVEIHAAHDTVPQFFLSPYTNRRTDRWGGSPENRVRFLVESVRRIRDRLGTSINVGIRICADERRDGGYDLDGMKEMARIIVDAVPVDYLNVDVGSFWGYPSYIPPAQYGVAPFADSIAAIREAVNDGRRSAVPILGAGRINDVEAAERLIAAGVCDLVAMTRASIADPEFPEKARAGRIGEIRKCIGCNTCIGKVIHDEIKTAICAVNPVIGQEAAYARMEPAKNPSRVVVIGAGPAGLEAARVAAERGHSVVLLEKGEHLGGALRLAARVPGRDAFLDFPRWHEGRIEKLGIDLRLGTDATAETVLALEPDAVVVATGAVPRASDAPGADGPRVVQALDVLAGAAETGERVLIVSEDDRMTTPGVADVLAGQGKQVEIIHKWLMIAEGVERYTKALVFHRLRKNGVVVHPSVRLRAVDGPTVVGIDAHTGEERRFEGVDTVVLSLGMEADDRVYRELRGRIDRLFIAGSAFAPRLLAQATRSGAGVGALL